MVRTMHPPSCHPIHMPCHIAHRLEGEVVGVLEVGREVEEVTEIQAAVILCSRSSAHNCDCESSIRSNDLSIKLSFLKPGKHASHIVEYLADDNRP